MKKIIFNLKYIWLVMMILLSTQISAQTNLKDKNQKQINTDTTIFKSGYVSVNGIKIFYKESGEGTPLLFLHGGLGTSETNFPSQLKEFSKTNRMVTIHTRAHGKSEFGNQKLTYELFVDDVFDFLEKMNMDSVNLVGFSDGGIIGSILAIQHPEKVKNLIIIGTNLKSGSTTFYPETVAWLKSWDILEMAGYMKSVFKEYPEPDRLAEYVENMRNLYLGPLNLKDEDLEKIKCPTLIIAGDQDLIKTEHQVYLFRTIPGSSLMILPKTGHNAHIARHKIVNNLIAEFIQNQK